MSELDWLDNDDESGLENATMTNRQWLMWKLIDMSDKELLKQIPGVMFYVCTEYIHLSCKEDCRSIVLAWLKKEHKEG